jgi:hypothetical protein
MTQVDKKIEWCLRKAEREGQKHKGLKKVLPNNEKVKKHLGKAKRNLLLIDHLVKINFIENRQLVLSFTACTIVSWLYCGSKAMKAGIRPALSLRLRI